MSDGGEGVRATGERCPPSGVTELDGDSFEAATTELWRLYGARLNADITVPNRP